jgi:hypothetical protein
MPLSSDVKLAKTQQPVFPDRCIACGQEQPGNTIRVCTNAVGWWTIALWTFGPRFCVDVPACGGCRHKMVQQRWTRRIITWGLAFIGAAVAMSVLQWYQGPLKRWLTVGIAFVSISPWFLWQAIFPPPIDLTAYTETVVYEFRNAVYAEEFASLNDGRIE